MRSSIRRTLTFPRVHGVRSGARDGLPQEGAGGRGRGAPPPPTSAPTVTELAPLTDDGGPDARRGARGGQEAERRRPGYNANQLKIKACCNAMRAQAKAMGSSPEAFQVNALAAQCDMFATQVGPAGNAPELNQLRQILKSITLPAACQM